jgi:ketosteroid isomerase-like protein
MLLRDTLLGSALTLCALTLCACSANDEMALPGASDDESSAGDETLSRDEQIALIEERLAATNRRDWDTWQSLHTPGAIRTAPELEEPLVGSDAMRFAIETLGNAFPDYHLELRQAFGQGEWLALRIHTTGTMTGPLVLSDGSEVPATGQPIEQDWAALVRFQGDRISEFHEFYDQFTLMMQLGVLAQ